MKTVQWCIGGASLASAMLLAACGGGDDSSGGNVGQTPSALTLSGTAATGPAIGGAAVEAKCATGSGSGTTQANGDYSLSISGGQWPCLARVTAAGSSVLHTAVFGSGNNATANITPVTQLVLANATGSEPAAYYAAFGNAGTPAPTSTELATAQTAVLATLKSAGIDLSAIGDVISGALRADTAGAAGDAYAQALDTLAATLTSSDTTLATLTSTLANNSVAVIGGAVPASEADSLPADKLLATPSSNCAALRSGNYRVVSPLPGGGAASQSSLITVDAATLTITFANGSSASWTANGACRFLGAGGLGDVLVSPAGVLAIRNTSNAGATYRLVVGFPEQSHTLAELAGTWNVVGMEPNAARSGYTGIAATAALDAAGSFGAVTWCQNDTTWSVTGADCSAVTSPVPSLRVNSSGGFDEVDPSATPVNGRTFVYRAGSGELMMVNVGDDGSFQFRTKQRVNPLPIVGSVGRRADFYIDSTFVSPTAVASAINTVISVDTAAGSWVRNLTDANGNGGNLQTLFVNKPRNGYNFRPQTMAVREWTSLGLRGMGASATLFPGPKWFDFTVAQP